MIIFHRFHFKLIGNMNNIFIFFVTNSSVGQGTIKHFIARQFFFKLFEIVHTFIKKTLWSLFMDAVQREFKEKAVYFLRLSSQKFMVLILSTSEGWKAELTLEPPSGFKHETPVLGIQSLNHKVKKSFLLN